MNILRFLRPECVKLALDHQPTEAAEDETPAQRANRLTAGKEAVLQEIADLIDRSGEIANPSKFHRDLVNRERKATTAIAPGIAIPHVRSMQARTFVIGFARAAGAGVPFDSLDSGPTRLFLILASPPYEDRVYLQVYREFSELIRDDEAMAGLLAAQEVNDVFNALRTRFR